MRDKLEKGQTRERHSLSALGVEPEVDPLRGGGAVTVSLQTKPQIPSLQVAFAHSAI